MRRHGEVRSAAGFGIQDHICWPYDDDQDFHSAAVEFLTDGRRLGQRLLYVGGDPHEKLREDITELEDVDALVDRGALEIMSLPDVYRVGEPVDAEAQLAVYAAATEGALADGFSGLRVVAEVTDLVMEPVTWAAHTRWELLADRYAASWPLSGICAYDRRALPDDVVADFAAAHPVVRQTATMVPFRLFAQESGLALEGEVDFFVADALDRLLTLAIPDGQEVELDLSGLEFMTHHGLIALAEHASRLAAGGGRLRLRGAPEWVVRICGVLDVHL